MFTPEEMLDDLAKLDPATTHPAFLGYCLHVLYRAMRHEAPGVNPGAHPAFLDLMARHFRHSRSELETAFHVYKG